MHRLKLWTASVFLAVDVRRRRRDFALGAMARSRRERSLLLDVASLRVFREVVARGGFTAASRVLGVTPPAVSLKISRLEERIGTRLIRRDGHSLTLTVHGRDLLAHAVEIVEAHDRAVDDMRRSDLSGSVRLGCSADGTPDELWQIASRFRRIHPDVDLAIQMHESEVASELLDDGEIDVAVLQLVDLDGTVRPTDAVWRRDELRVVEGLVADLADADPVPLVSLGPRSLHDPHLTALLDAAGRTHRIAMQWPNIRDVQSAIEAGLGVGVLNSRSVTDNMRPWAGIGAIELPAVAFVVRARPDPDRNELMDALAGHLSEALAASCGQPLRIGRR